MQSHTDGLTDVLQDRGIRIEIKSMLLVVLPKSTHESSSLLGFALCMKACAFSYSCHREDDGSPVFRRIILGAKAEVGCGG